MSNDSVYLSIKNCRKETTTLCPYYKFPENVINQEELTPLAKGLRLWVRLFQSAFYMYLLVLYVLTYLSMYVLYGWQVLEGVFLCREFTFCFLVDKPLSQSSPLNSSKHIKICQICHHITAKRFFQANLSSEK